MTRKSSSVAPSCRAVNRRSGYGACRIMTWQRGGGRELTVANCGEGEAEKVLDRFVKGRLLTVDEVTVESLTKR